MNQLDIAKNILITGGTGFVGLHLTRYLLKEEPLAEIVIVDNLFRGKRDSDLEAVLKNPRIRLIEADLTDKSAFKKINRHFDQVYHLAAINGTKFFYEIPHEVLRVNIESLLNILAWFCKGDHGKLIFSSSGETYAGSIQVGIAKIPTPETVPLTIIDPQNPRWSYGGSKIIGELLCLNYARMYKKQIAVVRFHNFYGPRMGFEHVIPEFCKRIIKGKNPFTINGGKETRAFCFIEDGVRALYLAMQSENSSGEIINLGNDKEEISIQELAKLLFKVTGKNPDIKLENAPEGSVMRRCPDISKARKLLRYEPKIKLEDGLRQTWEWYSKFWLKNSL